MVDRGKKGEVEKNIYIFKQPPSQPATTSVINRHPAKQLMQLLLLDRLSSQILPIMFIRIVLFRWFVVGFEQVDTVDGAAGYHFEIDGMEFYLFNLFLTLVEEHQLVGHIGILLLVLDRHVPDGETVVLAGDGDD